MVDAESESGGRRGIAFSHDRVAEDCSVSMTDGGHAVIDYELRGGESVRVVIDESDVEKHWKLLHLAQGKHREQEVR